VAARILFAADNSVMLSMLSVLMSHSGHQVQRADSGHATLNALNKLKPDVLIAELTTSDMDNYELCRRVRSDRKTAQLPIILIGPQDADIQTKSLAAGATCYVTTPVCLDHLLRVVDELLQTNLSRGH
jgi:CheY-like chemotaxis protein